MIDPIELTYTDRCSIWREVEDTDEYDETFFKETIIAENIRCALSKKNLANISAKDNAGSLEYDMVLFCSPAVDIQPSDVIKVTRFGREQSFKAGQSSLYDSHQEVGLIVHDDKLRV
ncbi:hypothetical protein [Dehalobacter sp. TeCB1]|uniref:hypothetical protein n=1 Tax=Dehalobacter sp. TeCB1 TaxID=1843715 RepID=UPI00083A08D0|nr:hypothetical protein [Dehalobacter sp. TeCB1]OCZ53797.1 hypothetical protein A7D23_07495 [Dehalobacter sp. TeCB1]